jgi:hypothetical protein
MEEEILLQNVLTLNTTGKKKIESYWKTQVHYGKWRLQQINMETEDGTPTKGQIRRYCSVSVTIFAFPLSAGIILYEEYFLNFSAQE